VPWYCFRSVSPAGLLINDVEIGPDRILITARCRAAAGTCPDCGRPSGIICDLERRRIVDLLPDREPATVEAWLSHHPEVRVIARDRGAGYGQAATRAAPQAVQVTDRWHLMENASAAVRMALGSTAIDPALLTMPSACSTKAI
jgi:transposase